MLAEIGDRIFTVERAKELASSAGISPGYLHQALHHMARSGWIVRLRRGIYALSGAVPGSLPLHEFEIGMALVQPSAISHWSALSYHGLTEQTPRHVFVLTPARSVPRLRGEKKRADPGYPVGNTIYRFVQVKPERFFGIDEVWVNEARIKITDPERTLIDGITAPQYCGDFSEVLHAFEVRGPKLDPDRIIGYFMRKLGYPIAPMVLATVLAQMLETSLQQSLLISQGSPMIFITRPISAVFIGLAILSLVRGAWKQMKSHAPEIAEEDES